MSSSEDEFDEDLARQLNFLKIGDNDDDEDPPTIDRLNRGRGSIRKKVAKPKPRPIKYPPHQPEALSILQQITGNSATELKSALYKTFLVTADHPEYKEIFKYIRNGQDHSFGIEVVNIIRIVRNNDFEFGSGRHHHHQRRRQPRPNANLQQAPSTPTPTPTNNLALALLRQNCQPKPVPPPVTPTNTNNQFRMMVWHGTKKQHISSILLNGFAKPLAKNQMFGTGIYFADRASKSAQYCDSTSPRNVGYMFLCDVKLGEMYKALKPHNDYTSPPPNFDTVKCHGKRIPDWKQNGEMRGAVLPYGRTVDNPRFDNYTLVFNEYIAYEPERVKAKYLVIVKFHAHPRRRDN